jgi:hypothetical protein
MSRAFDGKADLADMRAMTVAHGLFYHTQGVRWKGMTDVPAGHEQVPEKTVDVHAHHLPEAPPPPNPPPPSRKIVRPESLPARPPATTSMGALLTRSAPRSIRVASIKSSASRLICVICRSSMSIDRSSRRT